MVSDDIISFPWPKFMPTGFWPGWMVSSFWVTILNKQPLLAVAIFISHSQEAAIIILIRWPFLFAMSGKGALVIYGFQ